MRIERDFYIKFYRLLHEFFLKKEYSKDNWKKYKALSPSVWQDAIDEATGKPRVCIYFSGVTGDTAIKYFYSRYLNLTSPKKEPWPQYCEIENLILIKAIVYIGIGKEIKLKGADGKNESIVLDFNTANDSQWASVNTDKALNSLIKSFREHYMSISIENPGEESTGENGTEGNTGKDEPDNDDIDYDLFLARLIRDNKDEIIRDFDGIGWGAELGLQICPFIKKGWHVQDVIIDVGPDEYTIPYDDREDYENFFKENYDQMRFKDNGTKYMLNLRATPTAFSDSPSLNLYVERTTYSVVQFYRRRNENNEQRIRKLLRSVVMSRDIDFAHSLCLHAIIITADGKILAGLRPRNVSYSPLSWGTSVEEQMSVNDVEHQNANSQNIAALWAKRLLNEELGLSERHYDLNNIKLLAVFFESDCVNVSIAAHIKINITAEELKLLAHNHKMDPEVIQYRFLSYDDLFRELACPTNEKYHPSSRFRMLLELLHVYGKTDVARRLYNIQKACQ